MLRLHERLPHYHCLLNSEGVIWEPEVNLALHDSSTRLGDH